MSVGLIPALAGLGDDISGNVGDVLVSEAASESRHGALAVGDLGHDGLLLEATGKELEETDFSGLKQKRVESET